MLFFLTGSLGLCWALMYAQLFLIKKPRNYLVNKFTFFDELFKCSKCLGFWCGILTVLFLIYFNDSTLSNTELMVYPFASAAFCWFFDSLLDLIQR